MANTDFDGEELLALARLDVESKQLDRALAKIKYAFTLKEFPPELYSLGARLYAQLKLFSKAEALYKKYLEIDPNSVINKFQLGMVLYDSNDRNSALNIWQDLLRTDPTHPPTLYFSSVALAEAKDIESAKRNIDVLLKSAPVDNLYFERGKELLNSLNQSIDGNLANSSRKNPTPYINEN